MLNRFSVACFIAGCLGLVSLPLAAQEVVHALTGTVSSVDAAQKTVTLLQDTGSTAVFQDKTNGKMPSSFDKKIHAENTEADAFKKSGAYAIVFFCYGQNDARTVVGLRDLGAGPFTSAVGTVTRFEGHEHSISVTDDKGVVETFKISEDTVGEGGYGAVNGLKFQAQKGDHVRIVGTTAGGNLTALFIRQM
ncbi:MAG TPA: hypothetical protein VK716_03380 [Terracidiphilus sp.]|jgi:hypothetical protein|nr:hypothetical protein [Terracidiphilus sp.]